MMISPFSVFAGKTYGVLQNGALFIAAKAVPNAGFLAGGVVADRPKLSMGKRKRID